MTLWKGFDGCHVPDYMFTNTQRHVKEEGMKVRSTNPSITGTWVVVEQSPNYYIAHPGDYGTLATTCLSKQNYEPVPEWKDVTTNCLLLEDGVGRYSLFHFTCAIHANDPQYRVTTQGNSFKVERKS